MRKIGKKKGLKECNVNDDIIFDKNKFMLAKWSRLKKHIIAVTQRQVSCQGHSF